MDTTLKGAKSRYKRSPSSQFAAIRTAYPSFFKDALKIFNKDWSFSTSNADLGEVFILFIGGEGGAGGLEGAGRLAISNCGLVSMNESKCAIVSSPILRNF